MNKTIQKTGHVIRDLNKDLVDRQGDGLWAYASVEDGLDSMGDVVRVNGISYKDYHAPDSGVHLKILASHLKVLPDGTPPVIGRVEEFRKTTTSDGKPALAFWMTWAKDGEGNLSELAKSYKDLYDGGYLDSFSVGMFCTEHEPIKGGGYDLKKTTLMEISAVTIPANARANVIRALDDQLGEHLDRHLLVLRAIEQMEQKLEENGQKLASTCETSKEVEGRLTAVLQKQFDVLNERLDYIESSIVAKSESTPPVTGDRKGGNALKGIQEELARLEKQLNTR